MAKPDSSFLRNRIGFCVLHPIRECAGALARQTRVDGTVIEARFPQTIEPQLVGQSSFRDMRAVAHEVGPGLWAKVEFDGDVFEMEDQRNWTDASFKTYCTPLALPVPVEIQAGTRIRQSVTLRLAGTIPEEIRPSVETTNEEPESITMTVPDTPTARLPQIGLGMASHGEPLTETEIARLRRLHLAHLRADVRLSSPDWPSVWRRAVREAGQLGVSLELALHLPRDGRAGWQEFQRLLRAEPAPLARVLALREGEAATTAETLRQVRQALVGFEVPIGVGSDANFCELNREQALGQVPLADADFVFWSINPQVHAFDTPSIVETLEAQFDTVKTARAFAGGKPLLISPVTLRPRFNAVATGASPPLHLGELPPSVDPRQLSLFAAAWTLGSLVTLAHAGVESVTFYETTGWCGVMEREAGSPLPDQFPSWPGAVFPLYHVFADWAGCTGLAPAVVSAPSQVVGLAMFDGEGRRRVLLGNMAMQTRRIRVVTAARHVRVRILEAKSVVAAMREPEQFRVPAGVEREPRYGFIELDLPFYAMGCVEDE